MPGAILVSDQVAEHFGDELRRAAPGRPLVVLRGGERVDGDPAEVEVAFFSADLYPVRTRELVIALRDAPGLRWLHSFAAGVDHPWFQSLLARGIRLTNSPGASAVPIAHTVMLYLLALSRDLAGWLRDQAAARWSPRDVEDLAGARIAVLGMGPIGAEIARLATAFGMRVTGFRRTPAGDEPCETLAMTELDRVLPALDWLVLALPLTAETQRILDARRIALLPKHVRVVNVGRGPLVDEAALAAALAEGRIAGAALDVFEVEPLPAGSPLWRMPNVLVSPHRAGDHEGWEDDVVAVFVDNLRRFVAGEPLRNVVDVELGYAPAERSSASFTRA
jgi:phosphoglycerate dehydrogenase-like enzyme